MNFRIFNFQNLLTGQKDWKASQILHVVQWLSFKWAKKRKFSLNLLVIKLGRPQEPAFFMTFQDFWIWFYFEARSTKADNAQKCSHTTKARSGFWKDQQKLHCMFILNSVQLFPSRLANFSMCGNILPEFLITLRKALLARHNFTSFTLVIAGLPMKTLFLAFLSFIQEGRIFCFHRQLVKISRKNIASLGRSKHIPAE